MGKTTPCQNFYKNVCGKWKGSLELERKTLKEKAVKDLANLLEAACVEPTQSPNATDKLINAFQSCTLKAGSAQALKNSVKTVLEGYNLGQWPLQENAATGNKPTYEEILREVGPLPLFTYSVSWNQTKPMITISKPTDIYVSDIDDGGDYYSDYYQDYNRKVEEAYREFIKKTIILLSDRATDVTVAIDEQSKAADEIITVEKNLYKLAFAASNETKTGNLSSIRTLLPDAFPMQILERDFELANVSIKEVTKVEVKYFEYFQKVVQYLRNNTNTTQLINYVLWTKIRDMAKAVATPLNDLYLEYKNKTHTPVDFVVGAEKGGTDGRRTNDTKLLCMRQLLESDIMYTAGASYYSSDKFDKDSKADVMKMLHFINSTFRYVIRNNTWMSTEDKKKAVKRVNNVRFVIGYPDWILDSAVVNAFYQYVPNISASASFAEHYHWLQQNDRLQKLRVFNSSNINKSDEEITLLSHVYYEEKSDTFAYPAAAFATHYRKPPIPRSMNYGTIGTLIVQLLSNAIDRFDDLFPNGTKTAVDYWSNETSTNFCNNSMCLNNSKECFDQCTFRNTSRQELHDYLGVRVSHMAMRRSKQNYTGPFLLPGGRFNTEDKIFLTGFASLYCPYRVRENIDEKMPDIIPPNPLAESLNEVVSTYMKFNATFRCNGSVSDTCNLMPPEKLSFSSC
ncbi:membrane metallo-endopeptidase-like 1 [Amblyomma americanum]